MKHIVLLILFIFPNLVYAGNYITDFKKLLHYQNGNSLVTNNDYFLTSDGKSNIKAEINALKKQYSKPHNLGDQHPRCLFPDRYFLLNIFHCKITKSIQSSVNS